MPRNPLFFAVCALSLAILAAPASAGDCEQDNDQDVRIRGCSLIIAGNADGDKAIASFNRGVAYFHKGDTGRAIAGFNRAIELDPKSAKAFNNRGSAYRYKAEYDQAIADY